ncbi:MAG: hypothetical protein RLZZ584_2239 [Pseudomonadota bacterium]|jgi:hypothetical protein
MPPPRNAETNRWYRSGLFVDSRVQRADEDTQFATQFQRSPVDYLGGSPDIGRVVSHGVRELFISCEIGDALQQQFEHLRPTCIALHDLGCTVSRRLLAAVAAASGQPVERLVVRRAGFGTVIATIEFLDCAASHGAPIRLYSTDADADTQSRLSISRVLLGHATLGAILLGDLPAHALTELLEPLRNAMSHQPWQCQQMLFMPLGPGPAAGNAVHERLQNAVVPVVVSPRVTMPAEAWAHLHNCWNQLQRTLNPGSGGLQLAPLAEAANSATGPEGLANAAPIMPPGSPGGGRAGNTGASNPLPARAGTPLPFGRTAPGLLPGQNAPTRQEAAAASPVATAAVPAAPPNPLAAYIRGLGGLQGVIAACVFEVQTSRVLAHLGTRTAATDLARRGTTLLAVGDQSRKQLQLAGTTEEVLIRGGAQSLALRVLASQPEWAVHLVFSPAQCDWLQLRAQLVALDNALQRGPVF